MIEKLPRNWVQLKLKSVFNYQKGKKPKKLIENKFEGSVPYLDIKAFEENEIRRYADPESSNLIYPNQLGIVWDGARSGWVTKGQYGAVGSTIAILKPILINKDYGYLFLKSQFDFINSNTRGSGIPHVNPQVLWDLDFPLPPLAEQERIVAKLDDLFSRLESIKTSLDKIPQLLQNFRQQILTQAVTGKLTESINNCSSVKVNSPITIEKVEIVTPNNWKWVKLTDLAKLESGHTPRKSNPEYWENGDLPWISLQDIRKAHGKVITRTKFMPNHKGIKNSSARLLPKGTVCFSRDISVGFTTIMGKEMATTQHFANWICDDNKLYNQYLLYSFMAAKNHLTSSGQGTTVKTIYMPALKQLHLLLPPMEEQKVIVKRVEGLLDKADNIQEKYELLKAKVEQLPQATLLKAFKGELVEQLESDGDARDLLRKIEELKKIKY
jgi:type I restriction enzyme, S subunit